MLGVTNQRRFAGFAAWVKSARNVCLGAEQVKHHLPDQVALPHANHHAAPYEGACFLSPGAGERLVGSFGWRRCACRSTSTLRSLKVVPMTLTTEDV